MIIFCFQLLMNQAATLSSNAWLQAANCCFQLRWFKQQRCVQILDFKLLIVASSCWWFKLQLCVQKLDFKLMIVASSCWWFKLKTLRSNVWLQAADCSFPAADDSSCNVAFKCLTSSCWLLLPAAMIQATTLRLNDWLQAADDSSCNAAFKCWTSSCWLFVFSCWCCPPWLIAVAC